MNSGNNSYHIVKYTDKRHKIIAYKTRYRASYKFGYFALEYGINATIAHK